MIKNWLRRRLGGDGIGPDDDEDDDEEPVRGLLVRKGQLVALRTHVSANREAFQRWYGDAEIAELLRHDLEPLTEAQSRNYFDTFILPASARGLCFAIHERHGKRLIGTTALTDRTVSRNGASALFRIVIGEKDAWGKGYGTEATRLVMQEAFESHGLREVRLEVFAYNERAIATYERVGFEVIGEHTEWVPRRKRELHVIEMRLKREVFDETEDDWGPTRRGVASKGRGKKSAAERTARRQRRAQRDAKRRRSGKAPADRRADRPESSQPGPAVESAD